MRASRRLRSAFSPGVWIIKDRLRTDPEACDKYVQEASAAGALFEHQSEHAALQITAPSISLRVNIGKVHQLAMRDPTDSFDLPDHVAYQMNIAFESIDDISLDAQVSETSQAWIRRYLNDCCRARLIGPRQKRVSEVSVAFG